MLVKNNTDRRIQRLPNDLANQIAAGEVIERPASVLKELLENSLDAHSTQIDVVIEGGGIGLIKVQDNGQGIHKEDLDLALAQHATSKILDLLDLEAIASYGFRGEALASIASVSKMKLTSGTEDQETGWSIERLGREEKTGNVKPAPRVVGTTIEVRDLFFNTPARRKFLRSERTETHYLEEVFKRVALSHPEVGFSLKVDGKSPKLFNICKSQEAYSKRLGALCGNNFIVNSQFFEAESNGLILKGWLGNASQMRATADLQYFYVNSRIIRDKVVNHAVRLAYQDMCTQGRYPAYILFLELDPAVVDVNVHPTKHEVRFRDARTIHAFITYSLAESLAGPSKNNIINASPEDLNKGLDLNQERVQETEKVQNKHKVYDKDRVQDKDKVHNKERHVLQSMQVGFQNKVEPSKIRMLEELFSKKELKKPCPEEVFEATAIAADDRAEESNRITASDRIAESNIYEDLGKPLCLLGGSLLLLEAQQDYWLIDIKSVYRNIIADALKNRNSKNEQLLENNFLNPTGTIKDDTHQKLLVVPLHIRLAGKMDRLRTIESACNDLGFYWTEAGRDSIMLRTIPIFLGKTPLNPFDHLYFENLFNLVVEKEFGHSVEQDIILCIAEYCSKNIYLTFEFSIDILKNAHSAQLLNQSSSAHRLADVYSRKFNLDTLKKFITG